MFENELQQLEQINSLGTPTYAAAQNTHNICGYVD